MRVTIEQFGRGRYSADSPGKIPMGFARDVLNMTLRTPRQCVLRRAEDRVWATRIAGTPVLGVTKYTNSGGTSYLLTKHGTDLYTFALTPATALASILSSMTASFIPSFAAANNYLFIADSGANYISAGTSATTYELQKTAPTASLLTGASSVGTAVGNVAGTIYFAYTDVTPEGVESPPSAIGSFTRAAADAGSTYTNNSLVFTAPYTTKNVYQSTAGSSQMYLLASGVTAANFAAKLPNTVLDTTLTTVSTVHLDDSTATAIEKPAGQKYVCAHKGRLFMATGHRLRWSLPGEPTQFSNQEDALLDVGDSGSDITGLVSFRGSLVIFKTTSIWVLNGDTDETNFVLFEAVPGKGCPAPHTIVNDGDTRILFLSQCGVLSFDLSSVPQVPLSDNISTDIDLIDWTSRASFFVAGIDPCAREYLLSVTPTGASTNTKTHVLSLDTGAWSRRESNMNQSVTSCYSDTGNNGPITNSTGQIKLYRGDEAGYLYEVDTATGADGVTSGDKSGVLTARTSTTSTVATGAFRTTGDGLKGLGMTLYRAADETYETVLISSNTATEITHAAFSGTAAVIGDTIYVGAYEGMLLLNRLDLGSTQKKLFKRILVGFEKESHSISLRVGYALDQGTAPTASVSYLMSNGFKARRMIDRAGQGVSVYLDIIGVGHEFELLSVAVDAEAYLSMGTTS